MTILTDDELKAVRERAETRVNTVMAAHDRRALLRHIDALEKDAARYRWLRSEKSGINDVTKRVTISNQGAACVTLLAGEALDAAIDAARKLEETP